MIENIVKKLKRKYQKGMAKDCIVYLFIKEYCKAIERNEITLREIYGYLNEIIPLPWEDAKAILRGLASFKLIDVDLLYDLDNIFYNPQPPKWYNLNVEFPDGEKMVIQRTAQNKKALEKAIREYEAEGIKVLKVEKVWPFQ